MKNLTLIFSAILAFALGAVLGDLYDFNPILTGVGALFLSAFASIPSGSLAAGMDISAFATLLGNYWRKYEKEISNSVYYGLELENLMTPIGGITDEYVSSFGRSSNLLQPGQTAWTPQGAVTLTPYINKVRPAKLDFVLDNLDDLYVTYLSADYTDENKDQKDWPFVKWVVMNHLIPKMIEEVELMSGQGVYDAPTPGTAGGFMDITDGIITVCDNLITAGDITPITTGAITASNILDRVEFFCDNLDNRVKNAKEVLIMSHTNARRYMRDYRAEFGSTGDKDSKANLKIDATNITIVGVQAFEGRDTFLHTPKANLLRLFDKKTIMSNLQTQQWHREVHLFSDMKKGYGFRTLEFVSVNDQ